MSAEITSITGLTNFSNITYLEIDRHQLRTLDVSGLSNLTELLCNDNNIGGAPGLSTLNVTGCSSLLDIRMDDNDFSEGFPDLSTCTSLEFFDADQCGIQGTLDLSNLPSLKGFDVFGNENLTNIVISSTQPLGDGFDLSCNGTALTQTSLDNILQALASGSINNGYFSAEDGNQGYPSEYGVNAIRALLNRGWTTVVQQYSNILILTSVQASSGDACAQLLLYNVNNPGGYIHKDATIEVGSIIYDDAALLIPKSPGWYGYDPDGVSLLLDNDGMITTIVGCA